MKRAYFVDTSAYLAYARNEFWTPALGIGNIYTPNSIITELNNVITYENNCVNLTDLEKKRLDDLVNKTTVISDSEISDEVMDAHNRSIVRRQILNPDTIMGNKDIKFVEAGTNFARENCDLDVVVFTADRTMGSAVDLINRKNLSVIEPFSKTFFESTKKVKPHFALEDAISDLSNLRVNSPEGENIYGNVLIKNGLGYVHSFTEGPGVKNDRFNSSYLINFGLVTPHHNERIFEMYKSGGVFSMVGKNSLGLTMLKKKPVSMRLIQVKKNLNGRNPTLHNQTVNGINREFVNGHNSVVYTICKNQLRKVTGSDFYNNMYDKRELSISNK